MRPRRAAEDPRDEADEPPEQVSPGPRRVTGGRPAVEEPAAAEGSRTRRSWFGPLRAGLFGVVALAVGLGASVIPSQQADTQVVPGVTPGQTLVCQPSLEKASMAVGSTSPSLQVGELTGEPTDLRMPAAASIGTGARLVRSVTGQGRPVATTLSTVGSGAAATSTMSPCTTAATGGTLIVADPSSADIIVTNPDSEEATVDVSLSGAKGAIDSEGSRGITVPARSSKALPLSVWATGTSPVSATVRAESGRIVASARTGGSGGREAYPMSQASQGLLLPAVPAGATSAELLLSNPGSSRTTVSVKALASGGAFTPEGADQVQVDPQTTIAVDMSKALAGEAVALQVSADSPVAAQLMSVKGSDRAMAVPAGSGTRLQSALPAGGTLAVSNPSQQAAQFTGSFTTTAGKKVAVSGSVAPGATFTKDLGPDVGFLQITATRSVTAGVWTARNGLSSVPLSLVAGAVKGPRMGIDPQLS